MGAVRNILRVPIKGNEKLERVIGLVDNDLELQTLWRCSNIQSIDRMGYSDHGPVHAKIVANAALKMLRILVERGVEPNIVKEYGMEVKDAEVVVFLAATMHDIGLSIIREEHEVYSVQLAQGILRRYLPSIYAPEEATIVASEILHAIICHHAPRMPLTVEAGVVKIADALDMEKGRSRIPFEAGKVDIRSISALSIEQVDIEEGEEKPILIRVRMSNPSGIFQVDNLLGAKIKGSGLEEHIHVEAVIGEGGERIIERFEL
jgi:hypothetical protein